MMEAPLNKDDLTIMFNFALTDEQLEFIGYYDTEKLRLFQGKLEEEIKKTRDVKRREQYFMLLGRVVERLEIVHHPLVVRSCNRKRFAYSSQQLSMRQKSSTTISRLPRDNDDDRVVEQYGNIDISDDDDDDDNDNYRIAKTNDSQKQVELAMQQLVGFQAVLRQRLVRAKEQLERFQTTHATQNEIDSKRAFKVAIENHCILAELDEATGLIDPKLALFIKTEESRSGSFNEDSSDQKVLNIEDIWAAIDESKHCWNIKKALDHGVVKPFFHTLFLPETFLNHRRSGNEVKAGKVDPHRTVELDEMGGNLDEPIETGRNLDQHTSGHAIVVGKDGIARGANIIIDDSLGMGSKWKFSHLQTGFAVALVNSEAELLGANIECTTLNSIPVNVNADDNASGQLLTRPESRGVVAEIFHHFAMKLRGGSVSAITGSPGIGKSWTLFYALQQALLYDGATVLFFFQKRNDAVLYLRRNNEIFAWKAKCNNKADSNLFKQPAILVLLDPDEARNGGAQFALGEAKVLLAASISDDHFKNGLDKCNKHLYAFLGPPFDEELLVILKRLDPQLKRRIIQSRKKEVGNLIRYILNENYDLRKAAIKKAVEECVRNEKSLETVVRYGEMSAGRQNLPGRLFEVSPTRPTVVTEIGYDGQQVDYRVRVVHAVTEKV